ncbi:hypothetical protein Tco_0690429 [Tanacetum coccineum]
MTNKIDTVLKAITDRITGELPSDTVKNSKLNVNSTTPVLSARSYPTDDPKGEEREEMSNPENLDTTPPSPPDPLISFITEKYDDSHEEGPGDEGNMTINRSSDVYKHGTDEIAYKMPHKIEQYNSLSDLEKEHIKLVYLRNEEDKRRGVEYAMSKILRFYKECLELGPEYLTGVADEEEVT